VPGSVARPNAARTASAGEPRKPTRAVAARANAVRTRR